MPSPLWLAPFHYRWVWVVRKLSQNEVVSKPYSSMAYPSSSCHESNNGRGPGSVSWSKPFLPLTCFWWKCIVTAIEKQIALYIKTNGVESNVGSQVMLISDLNTNTSQINKHSNACSSYKHTPINLINIHAIWKCPALINTTEESKQKEMKSGGVCYSLTSGYF